jgi:hypothetical protein
MARVNIGLVSSCSHRNFSLWGNGPHWRGYDSLCRSNYIYLVKETMVNKMTSRKTITVMKAIARQASNGGVDKQSIVKAHGVKDFTVDKLIGTMRRNGLNIAIKAKTTVDYKAATQALLKEFPVLGKKAK